MVMKLNLQRDDLAVILGDNHNAIRQFEKLFQTTSGNANDLSDLLPQIAAIIASAQSDARQEAQQKIDLLSGEIDDLKKQVGNIVSMLYPAEQETPTYLETKKQVAANKPGRINWTSTGQFNAGQDEINLPIGAISVVRAVNASGFNLAAGRAVRLSGAVGGVPAFNLAGCETIFDCIGLVSTAINGGETGYICHFGLVENMDATGAPYGEIWNVGDVIYVGVGSALTKVMPAKPLQQVPIAIVVSATSLFVIPYKDVSSIKVSDFNLTSLLSGDLLTYNATTGMWVNKRLTQNAGGIVVTNLPGEVRLSLSNIVNDQPGKIIGSSVALTSTAGANIGTLTNCPVAGNPTAYFAITDTTGTYVAPFWKI